ncbi:hypothetical protein CBR_g60776 [Chara braunii]|uniref:Uncharacterized protein n=1 Tax=Chara braunii TaxID=69332 RepID=A0A388MF74_CHABU|nr:hypothetical protein CBR_g60776 [Chara braunii]|eukprot:GBG93217.1 hypothetical protein CBR_g60776 [Chara braunii]
MSTVYFHIAVHGKRTFRPPFRTAVVPYPRLPLAPSAYLLIVARLQLRVAAPRSRIVLRGQCPFMRIKQAVPRPRRTSFPLRPRAAFVRRHHPSWTCSSANVFHRLRSPFRSPLSSRFHDHCPVICIVHVVLRPRGSTGKQSQASFFRVLFRQRKPSFTWSLLPIYGPDAPTGASAKGRKDGGVGDGGETNKGRDHIPKSKRQRIDDASSSQTEDFLADELAMVDAQGTAVVVRLGFGRDRVSREQLQAARRSVVGGAARTVPRSPNTAGVVVTAARVAGQISEAAGQGQPLPLQHVLATGGGHTATAQKGNATATASRTAAADHTAKGRVVEGAERVGVDDVGRDDGRRYGKREGNDGGDRPLVPRGKGAPKEDELQEKAKLWVDCDAFWNQGLGKPLREAVGECINYFVAVANGDAGAEPPSMLIMPPNDVPRFKIDDPAQREPALRRARSVERVVLRTIHGWIFKSRSRWTGFSRAESYITVHFATDFARAVWQALEWSRVVSPALV